MRDSKPGSNAAMVKIGVLTAFVVLLGAGLAMTVLVIKRGVQIESNLQSISPHYIPDPELEQASNQLAQALQQTLLLVAKSDTHEALELLLEDFPDQLQELPLKQLRFNDAGVSFEQFIDAVTQQRFYLLTDEQLQALDAATDAELVAQAQRQLYSVAGSARLLPLTMDPLGLVSDYALQMLENLPGTSESQIISSVEDSGELYYLPFTFSVLMDAQDFNQQANIAAEISRIEQTITAIAPEVSLLHSGVFFFSVNAASSAKADITLISTGSTLGIIVLLLVFFRSLRTLVLPLVSIGIGVGFAFVSCQLIFGSIHIFTVVFGASLIGVVIDYALHYAYHFNQQNDNQLTLNLYRALLLSLVTSAIGYGALMFSGLAVLQQVAVFSVLGLASAWLAVLALGPLLLSPTQVLHDSSLRRLLATVLRYLQKVSAKQFALIYTVVIVAAIIVVATMTTVSDSPRQFFEPDPQLLAQEEELGTVLSQFEPATYLVFRGATEEDTYQAIHALFEQMPTLAAETFGPSQLLAAPAQRQQVYQANARLYAAGGVATQFLTSVAMAPEKIIALQQQYQAAAEHPPRAANLFDGSQLPVPPLWQVVNRQHFAFYLLTRSAPMASLQSYAAEHDNVFVIDSIGLSTSAIQSLRESANRLLILAVVLVGLVMVLRYRKLGSLSMIAVPLAAITLTLAIFAVSGVAVSLFHIMALFLVVGLGMDYVIFIADLRAQSQPTLCAVVLSAFTSLLAFGLLSASQIPIVQAFGLTVLIGNSINFLGSLLLARFIHAAP